MDKTHFAQLVQGVKEMKRHIRDNAVGKPARRNTPGEPSAPDVRVICEAAQISQSQFAKLIGVNLRTLQNWEQHRTRPRGTSQGTAENCGCES